MTNNYKGIIIEESLQKNVLKNLKKIHTEIEEVTEKHKTSRIAQSRTPRQAVGHGLDKLD